MSAIQTLGLKWRSSYWFVTSVVGLSIATDLVVYSIIIPVMPFELEKLGYTQISSKMGWLLFAFSAGLVLSTPPIAAYSEKSQNRQRPLILGICVLIGSQIMMMELARHFWVLCIARILQGVGSTVVWTLSLALLCDSTPPKHIGRQLGIAMTGLTCGLLLGPAAGGALYERFGFRGPFIFGVILAVVDLVGRLAIIERKNALVHNHDPWGSEDASETDEIPTSGAVADEKALESQAGNQAQQEVLQEANLAPLPESTTHTTGELEKPLSLMAVVVQLGKSPRALVALIASAFSGLISSSLEPALPLHLNRVWGLDPDKIGITFLASVVPTIFSTAIGGYLSEKVGEGPVGFVSLLLGIPWVGVLTIEASLGLFIASFALQSFFVAILMAPVTSELAAVSRNIRGVGYAHVYGAFNLVFGVGSAVGPIIGGQIYEHLRRGWMVLCLIGVGVLTVLLGFVFCFTGTDTMLMKVRRVVSNEKKPTSP